QPTELRLEHPAVGELEEADPLRRRAEEHRAEGGLHPREVNDDGAPTPRRRAPGEPAERVLEAAERLVPAPEPRLGDRRALRQLVERPRQAPRPLVRVEGHTMMLLEPATKGRR